MRSTSAPDPRALTDEELRSQVIELRAELDAKEAEWLGLVREADRRRVFEADGSVTMQAWLRTHCRLSPGHASGVVKTGRQLAELPLAGAAFHKGQISFAHARQIAMLAEHTSLDAAKACESALVTAARLLDPLDFARELRAIRESWAPEPSAKEEEKKYGRQRLHLSPSLDGMYHLSGLLTAESGEIVQASLQPLMKPLTADDKRPAPQRRAEALVEVCCRVLGSGTLPDNGGVRPHALITIDWPTLCERAGIAVTEWDATVTAEAARRLLCDAGISRVLVDQASAPLDVGRTARTVTPAQRRALIVRDCGCVWPGCRRPPAFCEAHHLISWIEGGETNLGNLALLCRYHHRMFHEGRWTLSRLDDGAWLAIGPDGRRLTRPPPQLLAA